MGKKILADSCYPQHNMDLLEKRIQCPYCWEYFEIFVDPSEGDGQFFVYDCEVCCRPIDVQVQMEGSRARVQTKKGTET